MYVDNNEVRDTIYRLLDIIIQYKGRVLGGFANAEAISTVWGDGYCYDRKMVQFRLKDGRYVILSKTGNVAVSKYRAAKYTFMHIEPGEKTYFVDMNFFQYIKFRYKFRRAFKYLKDWQLYVESKNGSEELMEIFSQIR